MNIAKQIVDQRILKIIKENPDLFADTEEKNISKAFLLLGVSAYLDLDISEAAQYITDGGNDGGFDAAYMTEGQDLQLNVVLFQSKYVRNLEKDSNFPTNAIEKAVNTIKCVFDPSSASSLNEKSQSKVDEIRSFILDGRIPFVTFVMLNNGLPWTDDGQTCIDNHFKGQEQVQFVHFNHSDIISYINRHAKINAQISLTGEAIQENFNYKSVLLGRISVMEIYKLMDQFGDSLLEKNIRRYLGRNAVNNGIVSTLLDENKKQNFFFYNNGITFVCDRMRYNALQKQDWILKAEGLQVINGGQTCKTIYQTIKDNSEKDFSDVFVLLRLYEIDDEEGIVADITYATNSQNPVDFRDLKSNDSRQVMLETGAKDLGYIYKRKRDAASNVNAIPITVAAEAVLSVWRGMPHIARYRKNDLFDSYYETVFDNLNAAQMIVAVLIFRFCDTMRKRKSADENITSVRPFEAHFVANMLGKMILAKNDLSIDELSHKNFNDVKNYFEESKETLFEEAEKRLIEILQDYFRTQNVYELDGRTIAAPFRRFDLMQLYINNENWLPVK